MVDRRLMGKKTEQIHFMVTPELKQQVVRLAEELNLNLTDTMQYIVITFFDKNLNSIQDESERGSSCKASA